MKRYFLTAIAALLVAPPLLAAEYTRDQWRALFVQNYPAFACDKNYYFRQCLQLEADQCESAATSAARTCLGDLVMQIPEVVQNSEQSAKAGTLIAQCAGVRIETRFSSRRLLSAECQDISRWR